MKTASHTTSAPFIDNPTILVTLQQQCIIAWKNQPMQLTQDGFLELVEQNHAYNFKLWHAEDRARRNDKGHEFVYLAKREIDHCNQQRNNAMEAMDQWLYDYLQPTSVKHCAVHSETPGMIIDRLSILALKIYHMDLQTKRDDVDTAHQQNCLTKYAILTDQQHQLTACLTTLFQEILRKQRTFRVYRQFKMYNDPLLNPELYGSSNNKA